MWLQLILFFLAFVVCQIFKNSGDIEKNRHLYVTFLIILLVLQSGLRHLAVGEDTYSYYQEWENAGNESWGQIFSAFYNVYALGIGKDAGYGLVLKLLSYVIPTYRIFLIVYAIAFFITLCRFVEGYLSSLNQLFLFFCLYQVMFYSFFSVTGIRQGMATIFALQSIKFVKNKKLIWFVVLIALASFIHKSVLLFLPFYFIYHFHKSKPVIIGSLCALPFMFGLARPLATLMVNISNAEQYRMYAESSMETGGAINFLVLILTIVIASFVASKNTPESIPDFALNSLAVALVFTPLMWVDTSLMRVIQYYSIFALISMPLAIDGLTNSPSMNKMLYSLFVIVLIFTTIRHNYQYAFFWQDMQLPIWYN